jgi:hypothetical protein
MGPAQVDEVVRLAGVVEHITASGTKQQMVYIRGRPSTPCVPVVDEHHDLAVMTGAHEDELTC